MSTETKSVIGAVALIPGLALVGYLTVGFEWPFGYFFVSTFLFGMMFAELSHFFGPFMEGGTFHYTPGMYTAILPIIGGWYVFRIILREMSKERNNAGPDEAAPGRAAP